MFTVKTREKIRLTALIKKLKCVYVSAGLRDVDMMSWENRFILP